MAREVTLFLLDRFKRLLGEADSNQIPLTSHFKSMDRTIKSKFNIHWESIDQSFALKINSVLYDVVDTLSECVVDARRKDAVLKNHLLVRSLSKPLRTSSRIWFDRKMKSLSKPFSYISRYWFNRRMDSRLIQIEERLKKLDPPIYGYNPKNLYKLQIRQFPDPSKIVGFHDVAQQIESKLNPESTTTVGIVGMGGSGKTVLVGMIFNRIRHKFDISIWVCLSEIPGEGQVSLRADLLKYILDSLGFKVEQFPFEFEINELIGNIRRILEGKKYLIVFDDVWNIDEWYENLGINGLPNPTTGLADKLSESFPKGSGGAIIVTSRIESVAKRMVGGKNNIININKHLSDKDIWSIFVNTHKSREGGVDWEAYENTLKSREGGVDWEAYEKKKNDIVNYCDKLPLAATVLAGGGSDLSLDLLLIE